MTYELTVDEKATIINNHIRNIAFRKFSSEIELIAENAVPTPNAMRVTELTTDIAKCESQLSALTSELEGIE